MKGGCQEDVGFVFRNIFMYITNWTDEKNKVVGEMIDMVFKKFSWYRMQRDMGK